MLLALLDQILPAIGRLIGWALWSLAEALVTSAGATAYRRVRYRALRRRVLSRCLDQDWEGISVEFRTSLTPGQQRVVLELLTAEAVDAMPEVLVHAFTTGDQWTSLAAAAALRRTNTVPPDVAAAVNETTTEGRWGKAILAHVKTTAGVERMGGDDPEKESRLW